MYNQISGVTGVSQSNVFEVTRVSQSNFQSNIWSYIRLSHQLAGVCRGDVPPGVCYDRVSACFASVLPVLLFFFGVGVRECGQ